MLEQISYITFSWFDLLQRGVFYPGNWLILQGSSDIFDSSLRNLFTKNSLINLLLVNIGPESKVKWVNTVFLTSLEF